MGRSLQSTEKRSSRQVAKLTSNRNHSSDFLRSLRCDPLEDRRLLSVGQLDLSLVSCDSQNFPFVYVNVRATLDGQPINYLTAGNFSAKENGKAQTNYFSVTPPETGGNLPRHVLGMHSKNRNASF
jgi:hypothetical protein